MLRPFSPHPCFRTGCQRRSAPITKTLTDADHFSMIRNAQRRFAPTVIGITRNGDRHQIGMCDRHRRNAQHLSQFGDLSVNVMLLRFEAGNSKFSQHLATIAVALPMHHLWLAISDGSRFRVFLRRDAQAQPERYAPIR
jgi:hypothetical protein